MPQDRIVKMKCVETGEIHYVTRKSRTKTPLQLKKYNKKLRKRAVYKETK